MDGAHGYWAEDDETGEVGFLDEFDDVFWIHDDHNDSWIANRFRSRRMRKGILKVRAKEKVQKANRGSKEKERRKGQLWPRPMV